MTAIKNIDQFSVQAHKHQEAGRLSREKSNPEAGRVDYDLDIELFEGPEPEALCSVSNTCTSCSCTCSCATCGGSCPYC